MFIRDSNGNKSLTATMAYVSFAVVMLKVLLSGASISLGSFSYSFGAIDALMIGAIFGPILGTYTARRWNDPSPPDQDQNVDVDGGSKPSDGRS